MYNYILGGRDLKGTKSNPKVCIIFESCNFKKYAAWLDWVPIYHAGGLGSIIAGPTLLKGLKTVDKKELPLLEELEKVGPLCHL